MKALRNMTTVERAKLFSELFPEELPGIIRFIELKIHDFEKNAENLADHWGAMLDQPDFWTELARKVKRTIVHYNDGLIQRPSLFADQLFDGQNSLLTTTCLILYADTRECPRRVGLAINLLFGT